MGLDTIIYFTAKPGFDPETSLESLPPHFEILPLKDYIQADYPEATHELSCMHRYYGSGYERGPWPDICAALMVLLSTKEITCVWYGSDCHGAHKILPQEVVRLSLHYMQHAHRPYRDYFKAVLGE